MIDLYVADIRCDSENAQMVHEGTLTNEATLQEVLEILKEVIEENGVYSCICLSGQKIVLKYKFGDEIICPKELINAQVESIDHVIDDGGVVYYIKLKEAA